MQTLDFDVFWRLLALRVAIADLLEKMIFAAWNVGDTLLVFRPGVQLEDLIREVECGNWDLVEGAHRLLFADLALGA